MVLRMLAVLCLALQLLLTAQARASGPVERMVQVLVQPNDSRHVVVRWGIASEGLLISHDGGTTFAALCSQAISSTEKLRSLSGQKVPAAAATLIDANGKVLVGQLNGLWSDDGAGCAWTKQLDPDWVNALRLTSTGEVLALMTVRSGEGDAITSKAELRRRDLAGSWTTLAPLRPDQAMQRVYGAELVAGPKRLYASASVAVGSLDVLETFRVFLSEDGGASWKEQPELPKAQQDGFVLLAVDPLDETRVLAANYRDSAIDTLLLSEDSGATFRSYADIREISAVVFGPDGRLYVGDAGDSTGSTAIGGLWTAARTGEPLALVAGTQWVDCLSWDAEANQLRACKRDHYGTLDPISGTFSERTRLDQVQTELSCPGNDVVAACSAQLNAGASWCCAGHYPFTPFCGAYDVTIEGAQRVYCGLAGREADAKAGRVPPGIDAGSAPPAVVDAGGVDGGNARPQSKDGCALRGSGVQAAWLALAMFWWGRRRRRSGSERVATRR